jgi:hydroxypyruvate reductase
VERGRSLGLDAATALEANDSYRFFSAEGGLLVTGPTRTNVMDLVLALLE